MRAATIADGTVSVQEHPDPVPGHGEVLVRVRAAGLNGADLLQRKGAYPAPAGSPADIPGLELAGEVAQLGPGAERFGVGDRVMAIVGGGGQGELAIVHERQLMPIPEALDWPQAGGVPEVFTTAYDALFTQCVLSAGDRLLVHGAAGGVGTAAVQLGAATGAHVTATVRREEARDAVRALGAHDVIAPEDFAGHGPFDVMLELVGAPNMPGEPQGAGDRRPDRRHRRRARAQGRGQPPGAHGQAGDAPGVDAAGPSAGGEGADGSGAGGPRAAAVAARALRVPVAQTFALDAVHDAYEAFAAGGKIGKIVLTMD